MLPPEWPNVVNGVELSEGVEFTLREFFPFQIIDSILCLNDKESFRLRALLVFIVPAHHQPHVGPENANRAILVVHERDFVNRNLDLGLLPYVRGIEQRINTQIPLEG